MVVLRQVLQDVDRVRHRSPHRDLGVAGQFVAIVQPTLLATLCALNWSLARGHNNVAAFPLPQLPRGQATPPQPRHPEADTELSGGWNISQVQHLVPTKKHRWQRQKAV